MGDGGGDGDGGGGDGVGGAGGWLGGQSKAFHGGSSPPQPMAHEALVMLTKSSTPSEAHQS